MFINRICVQANSLPIKLKVDNFTGSRWISVFGWEGNKSRMCHDPYQINTLIKGHCLLNVMAIIFVDF